MTIKKLMPTVLLVAVLTSCATPERNRAEPRHQPFSGYAEANSILSDWLDNVPNEGAISPNGDKLDTRYHSALGRTCVKISNTSVLVSESKTVCHIDANWLIMATDTRGAHD